jgi:hypothetical protein
MEEASVSMGKTAGTLGGKPAVSFSAHLASVYRL